MTIFVGALTLDNKRISANRGDLFCCFYKFAEKKPRRRECFRHFFQTYYVPAALHTIGKIITISITVCLCTIGVMSCYKLELGLNQNVSLVAGSDIYDYFETMYTYGDAGPPAYLVFNNVNYTD